MGDEEMNEMLSEERLRKRISRFGETKPEPILPSSSSSSSSSSSVFHPPGGGGILGILPTPPPIPPPLPSYGNNYGRGKYRARGGRGGGYNNNDPTSLRITVQLAPNDDDGNFDDRSDGRRKRKSRDDFIPLQDSSNGGRRGGDDEDQDGDDGESHHRRRRRSSSSSSSSASYATNQGGFFGGDATMEEAESVTIRLDDNSNVHMNKRFRGGATHPPVILTDSHVNVDTLNLTKEQREIWDENPSLRQVFAGGRELIRPGRPLNEQDRILSETSGKSAYQRRRGEIKTTQWRPQRHLLLPEIEFFTRFASDTSNGNKVVWLGDAIHPAAPRLVILSTLFPHLEWVLIEPTPIEESLRTSVTTLTSQNRLTVHESEMTEELATLYSNKTNFLVSDIWLHNIQLGQQQLNLNLEEQMGQVLALRPLYSLLRLRLPYTSGTTRYLAGELRFPLWGANTTTDTTLTVTRRDDLAEEARAAKVTSASSLEGGEFIAPTLKPIVFDPSNDPAFPTKSYEHGDHEQIMFHFNTVTRTTYFEHPFKGCGTESLYGSGAADTVMGEGEGEKKEGQEGQEVGEATKKEVPTLPHIDHGYDGAGELQVLQGYLTRFKKITEEVELISGLEALSKAITEHLDKFDASAPIMAQV